MDYLCANFGDLIFSRLGFIVRTESQTASRTEAQVNTIATAYNVSSLNTANLRAENSDVDSESSGSNFSTN